MKAFLRRKNILRHQFFVPRLFSAPRQGGFTLVETLMASILATAILLPASFWLYSSRASRAAREKFEAAQVLETRLNRAYLLKMEKGWSEELTQPPLRLEIELQGQEGERRLLGVAKNRQGREICRLEVDRFHE